MDSGLQNASYETDTATDMSAASVKTAKKAPGAFLTISEVADELDVQQHVLRFWETKFSQLKPLKRGGGRRYYRPEDVELLKIVHSLLYSDKYTIKGVQKLLKGQSKMQILQSFTANNNTPPIASNDQAQASSSVSMPASPAPQRAQTATGLNASQKELLKDALADLKELRSLIAKS